MKTTIRIRYTSPVLLFITGRSLFGETVHKGNKIWRYILLIAAALAFLSCKKGNDYKVVTTAPTYPHGIVAGNTITKTIGAAGGTISTADGKLNVKIPAGAVTANTDFTITPVSSTLPESEGNSFRLGPENVKFNQPVEISFKYNEQDIEGSAEELLYMAYQDAEGYWIGLEGTTIDKANKTLKVNSTHFSDWRFYRSFYIKTDSIELGENESTTVHLVVVDREDIKKDSDPDITLSPTRLVAPADYKAQENVTGWKVIGQGQIEASAQKHEAKYTAPSTINGLTKTQVEVSLKNVVNKKYPDRAGTSGQVFVRQTIYLAGSAFNLYINGNKIDAPYSTIIVSPGNVVIRAAASEDSDKSIDLTIRGNGKGTYAYGLNAGTAQIRSSFIGIKPGHISSRVDCTSGQIKYSDGGITITEFGTVGGIVSGTFTGFLWWPDYSTPGVCKHSLQEIRGDFKVLRKQ